jgi:hypothetical protein
MVEILQETKSKWSRVLDRGSRADMHGVRLPFGRDGVDKRQMGKHWRWIGEGVDWMEFDIHHKIG